MRKPLFILGYQTPEVSSLFIRAKIRKGKGIYVTCQNSQIFHTNIIFGTRVSPPVRQKESITSGGSITKFERGMCVPYIHLNSSCTSLLSAPSRLSKNDEIIWLESFYKGTRGVQHLFYTSEIKII